MKSKFCCGNLNAAAASLINSASNGFGVGMSGDGDDVGIVAGLNKNLLSNGVVIDGGVLVSDLLNDSSVDFNFLIDFLV